MDNARARRRVITALIAIDAREGAGEGAANREQTEFTERCERSARAKELGLGCSNAGIVRIEQRR